MVAGRIATLPHGANQYSEDDSLATVTDRFSTEASNNMALLADHKIVLSGD